MRIQLGGGAKFKSLESVILLSYALLVLLFKMRLVPNFKSHALHGVRAISKELTYLLLLGMFVDFVTGINVFIPTF